MSASDGGHLCRPSVDLRFERAHSRPTDELIEGMWLPSPDPGGSPRGLRLWALRLDREGDEVVARLDPIQRVVPRNPAGLLRSTPRTRDLALP